MSNSNLPQYVTASRTQSPTDTLLVYTMLNPPPQLEETKVTSMPKEAVSKWKRSGSSPGVNKYLAAQQFGQLISLFAWQLEMQDMLH